MKAEAPVRVLVVEDEMMVALLVEDFLAELGHAVVGPAMHLHEAITLALEAEIDVAILDVNLGAQRSYPVAEVLRQRGIPFLFATGYGAAGVDEEYRGTTLVLRKPFGLASIERALNDVRSGGGAKQT